MDISQGFQLEEPSILVPWSVSQAELRDLLPKPRIGSNGLIEVTSGYFLITCKSLGGLTHELGFHFEPRRSDHLQELEFFRRSYSDLAASYQEFQTHFEAEFGPPTSSEPGSAGFPTHRWNLESVQISHFILDRFGPEEHMRIKRLDAAGHV